MERRLDPDDQRLYTREEFNFKYRDFPREEVDKFWESDCRPCANENLAGSATVTGYPAPDPHERRIDPEDRKDYSFGEFRAKVGDSFEDSKIAAYWFEDMRIDLPEGSKVFVSGMSKDTSADALNDRFSLCGEVASIQVCVNQETDESKGFAKVQFTTTRAADSAVRKLDGCLVDGQAITVRPLLDKGKCVRIFVAGLGNQMSEAEFEALFATCGEIVFSQLFIERSTREPNGQGKVEYVFPSSVQEAIHHFNKAEVGGRRVVVTEWRAENGHRVLGPSVVVVQLHPSTTPQSLRAFVEADDCVVVDLVVFMQPNTLKSRGIAKIELADEDSAKACIAQLDGKVLDGNVLQVREYCVSGGLSGRRVHGPTVFVAGFGFGMNVTRLKNAFSGCGEVVSASVFTERESGRRKGTGKVEFRTEAALKLALDLDGSDLEGRSIAVREFGAPFPTQRGPSRPPPGHTVFVAGLSADTTLEALKEHFAECGEVASVHIFADRTTGASRGVAKVTFATPDAQRKAIEEWHRSELDGKRLTVKEFGVSGSTNGQRSIPPPPTRHAVFVSGLNFATTAETLRDFFADAGEVKEAVIFTERATGRPRGIARVSFTSEAAVHTAINEWNNTDLDGRRIEVKEHTRTPGECRSRSRGEGCANGQFKGGACGTNTAVLVSGQQAESARPGWRPKGFSKGEVVVVEDTPLPLLPKGEGQGHAGAGRGRHESSLSRGSSEQGKGKAGHTSTRLDPNRAGRWRGGMSADAKGCNEAEKAAAEASSASRDTASEPAEATLHLGTTASAGTGDAASSGGASLSALAEMTEDHLRDCGKHAPTEERRIDPDDGQTYTLAELGTKYKSIGLYEDEVVREYWEVDCCQCAAAPAEAEVSSEAVSCDATREECSATGSGAAVTRGTRSLDTSAAPVPLSAATVEEWSADCHWVTKPLGAAPPSESAPQQVAAPAAVAAPVTPNAASGNASNNLVHMSVKDWVAAVDQQQQWMGHTPGQPEESRGVRELLGPLEEQFDNLNQIMQLYVTTGPDLKNTLADAFFEDLGIRKIGHKKLIKKWIRHNT